jgi:hypothetical protein
MALTEEIHILVIFTCDNGEVEQLALAAAVGAVQARASIRLRRMTDPAHSPNVTTERMDRDYVAPRAADTAWADGLVLAVANPFLAQLQALGGLAGKPAVCLTADSAKKGLQEIELLSDSELTQVVDRERARLFGRQVAETVRARRGSRQ